jgi:membrane protease YdiL (CAAX protease family)
MNRALSSTFSTPRPSPPSFWSTVKLLLSASRMRAAGRRKRQRELLQTRTNSSTDWGQFGFALGALFMVFLNVGSAFIVWGAVRAGERIEAERHGKIVVSEWFLEVTDSLQNRPQDLPLSPTFISSNFSNEARTIAEEHGGNRAEIEKKLRDSYEKHGTSDFITNKDPSLEFSASGTNGPFAAMLGSLALFWWVVMLVFQGEGLELDLQRGRHPMWEWLFAHPLPAGAIFLAEMLSPIAANPIYWGAPLFAGFVYGFVYDPLLGLLATVLIGAPVTIAAACLGKALEIGVVLRFAPRTRGAMLGMMSWLGYASMMLLIVGAFAIGKILGSAGRFLNFLTTLPWPWLRLFVGGQSDGSFSFLAGMLTCWIVACITVAVAVWFSVWGTQRGLSGNFGREDTRRSSVMRSDKIRFGKDPLYRKEFLWFIRDRSAIVQAILIPLTVAGFQVFNMRGILSRVQGSWNYLCGAAILFGTYFLWILGPKSLTSEGNALWISLTWPRGLESLLKAKAWLWSMISSGVVALVLCYAAFLFPDQIWKIALLGVGWYFFGRSMAEKTVTLVTVTSSSGETQPIPKGRRWAAQLGMLTFAIGVLTQQWHIAVMGIVYSFVTAAAMWESFRARLPYLYDPWSEKLPPPPTLMHAMVAISILIEAGAVVTGIFVGVAGRENIAIAQAISYAICAVLVTIFTANFLSERGVAATDVWYWPGIATSEAETKRWWSRDPHGVVRLLPALAIGGAGGLALGLFGQGYMAVLHHIPTIEEILRKSQEQMAGIPGWRISYAVMAVAFAPFAEEYLFRGLLFRALDREWGGWRAVVGSAAFFVIYHPPLAWLPVGLLGITNALLFKKTGRLVPAVILHMVYNAVVVS